MDINKVLKRERWIDIIISVILALIGIVLIAKPETTLNTIAMILGGIVIAYGLYVIVRFFLNKDKEDETLYSNGLVLGIMVVIFGLILFIYVGIIESLLRIIIGFWIVYNGLTKLLESGILKDVNKGLWLGIIISSLISVCLGLYIIFYSGALIKILGVFVLIYSIMDIIETIIYSKNEI